MLAPIARQEIKNTKKKIAIYLIAGLVLLVSCEEKNSTLVGTWKFISDQQIDDSGNIIEQDNNVDGLLTYTTVDEKIEWLLVPTKSLHTRMNDVFYYVKINACTVWYNLTS